MPCKRFALALVATLLSLSIFAQKSYGDDGFFSNPGPVSERNYLSLGMSLNEFSKLTLNLVRSEDISHETRTERSPVISQSGMTAQTYGMSLIFGSYLDDTFKTEFRYGKGLFKDTLDNAKDVNLDYWMSMLIGADKDITDYMSGYAMLGATYYRADVTRRETIRDVPRDELSTEPKAVQPSVYVDPPYLFETNFSLTWILGLDYKLSDQWYLSFEYGRLLKDTDTEIEIDQYSTYLKFEF